MTNDAKHLAAQPYVDPCTYPRLFLQHTRDIFNYSAITNISSLSSAMPPRKKAKASAASTPLRDTQPKTPQESGPSQSQDDLHNDPWADEQETQLFKSMMKWKPTGANTVTRTQDIQLTHSRPA